MTRAEYLFPNRLTRRDLLALGAVATVGAAAPELLAADAKPPVKVGTGPWTYELDESWGQLPAGMNYGFGCGIAADSKDRIYVTSRSTNPCVAIFAADGKLLETWSKDFGDRIGYSLDQVAATAHGIYCSKEGNDEFLYFTENVAGGPNGTRLGARVYKTDLAGKVLYTIGNVEIESATSQKFDWSNPTDVAVAPNGDIYVVDGYGSQRVSRFDKNFKHIKTIGAPGKEHGQFNTCHGVWISTLRDVPEVYIADRANGRYEVYSLDLDYQRTVSGDFVRNPCCFYQHKGHLYIPDLAGLVAIIDAADKPVATLGHGQGPKDAADRFIATHALTVDSQGSLYVLEWVPTGRVRKFKHTPA
jgi:DNA-binding beta-propeller fold protein YncE